MTSRASLLLDETANDLQSAVQDALAGSGDWASRLDAAETGRVDQHLWHVLRDQLGVTSLVIPEKLGGGGATWSEVAVVLQELGRHCAAVPYLGGAVTTPAVLLQAGADDMLESMGSSLYALAVPATQPPWDRSSMVEVHRGAVSGQVPAVADAVIADTILLAVGDALYAVDAEGRGVTRRAATSLDMTRPLCDFVFESAPARLVTDSGGGEAVERARHLAAALLASEQIGLARTCVDDTVRYLKQRRQFGRLLGSYQALKHRLADLWVDLTQATAVARNAAVTAVLDGSADFAVTASHAHAYCSDLAVRAAEEMLQLHGGIGFTWEHPTHLLLKRAKASQLQFGSPFVHRSRLAQLLAGDK